MRDGQIASCGARQSLKSTPTELKASALQSAALRTRQPPATPQAIAGKIDKGSLRRHIGRVVGHTNWYNDLLEITLSQLDVAMTAVTSKLATSR